MSISNLSIQTNINSAVSAISKNENDKETFKVLVGNTEIKMSEQVISALNAFNVFENKNGILTVKDEFSELIIQTAKSRDLFFGKKTLSYKEVQKVLSLLAVKAEIGIADQQKVYKEAVTAFRDGRTTLDKLTPLNAIGSYLQTLNKGAEKLTGKDSASSNILTFIGAMPVALPMAFSTPILVIKSGIDAHKDKKLEELASKLKVNNNQDYINNLKPSNELITPFYLDLAMLTKAVKNYRATLTDLEIQEKIEELMKNFSINTKETSSWEGYDKYGSPNEVKKVKRSFILTSPQDIQNFSNILGIPEIERQLNNKLNEQLIKQLDANSQMGMLGSEPSDYRQYKRS